MKMKFLKKYLSITVSLFAFLIYLFTIAPSVIQIDAGELATVQIFGGVAHPTGYPLFTIIGYLFSLLPLPFSKIFQMNLLAALFTAASSGLISASTKLVLSNINSFRVIQLPKKSKRKKVAEKIVEETNIFSENKILLISAFTGIIAALNKTFWFQSTSVEVYSLHLFLIANIIYFLLKAFLEQDEKQILKRWLLFALMLAFGFTNHMTTLLILPGTAYLFFTKFGFKKESFQRIGKMLLLFFPTLILFYSYLPIRAAQNPLLNWGNPITLDRILNHISGKQYQVWLFSSFDSAKKQFSYFISSLPLEYSLILVLAIVGMFVSFSRAKKYFLFTLINFAFGVLYSINYDINDIDAYFLLSYIMLACFSSFGILYLYDKYEKQKNGILLPTTIVAVVIVVHSALTFPKVNQSNNYAYEDYTKAILNLSEKNSLLFTYQWDYFISASYYFQYVENIRKDAIVVDKELLRRSWYYNQLSSAHPEMMKRIKNEAELFLQLVAPFENDEAYNQNSLELSYRSVMTRLIETSLANRTVYIGPELVDSEMQQGFFSLPKGYTIIPDLFFFKVVNEGAEYISAPNPDFKIRFPKEKDKYTTNMENFICSMLLRRAMYELQYDKVERAKIYVNKVKNDFPEYPIPQGVADAILK